METIVPKQKQGMQTGQSSNLVADTRHEALLLFAKCKMLLPDVNKWRTFCGDKGAEFSLTDENGQPLNKKAAVGELIRISLPAPKNPSGDGFDWVKIEAFEQNKDLVKDEEVFWLQGASGTKSHER